jgi:Tol biopolymer transport system component
MPSDEGQVLRLSWIAAQDQSTPVVTVPRNYSDPVLSPDGRRVALHLYDEDNDVWVADLSRGNLTRLTFGPDEEETPAWSPDGTQVVFAAQRENTRVLVSKPADGGAAAPERTIWQASEHFHVDGWSPDGKTILLEVKRAKTKGDIVAVDVESGETKDVIASSFDEYNARLSHDGRWLAFVSDESGRPEVYVQPYPALTTRALVSTAGGVEPVWSRDGRQLFFRTTDNVMVAAFTSTAPLEFGQPRVFAADRFARTQGSTHTHYDAGPDGRLLMIENPPDRKSGQQRLQVVLNWFEELTRLVPVK